MTNRVKLHPFSISGFLLAVVLTLSPGLCNAEQQQFRLGMYSSLEKQFPEEKGLVWTYRIIANIFSVAGFEVITDTYPMKRLAITLKNDEIDGYPGSDVMAMHINGSFERSRFPVSVATWYIYYLKGDWQPTWPPDDVFRKKVGKSQLSALSLKEEWGLTISSSDSVDRILKMIDQGRADYLLIDPAGSRLVSDKLLDSPNDQVVLAPLFVRPNYMYFRQTDKGRQLKNIYDQGNLALLKSRRYYQIYYEKDASHARSNSVAETLKYIRRLHPELDIPSQLPISP